MKPHYVYGLEIGSNMWTLWCFNSACERHCGNEPWPSVCPLNPRWPQKQEFQLTHHRSVFFSSSFCVFVASRQTLAGCRRGLTGTGPLPPLFSCPLSFLPFSRSSVWASLSCLLFSLIELFGRRACQTAPSMWGVWGAGGAPAIVRPETG